AMATLTKPRKQVKPAHGTVRVLRPIGAVNPTTGEIAINGRAYYLTRHATGYRLTGYDPRERQATVYDLPADFSSCDCPDATYHPERAGGCKHRKALTALQVAGQL